MQNGLNIFPVFPTKFGEKLLGGREPIVHNFLWIIRLAIHIGIIPLELRIEFSDRYRQGPSVVVQKVLDDKVTFTVLATGVDICSAGPPRLVLIGQDGTAITELRLDSPKTRNDSLILTGSVEKKEFDRTIGVLGSDKAFLE